MIANSAINPIFKDWPEMFSIRTLQGTTSSEPDRRNRGGAWAISIVGTLVLLTHQQNESGFMFLRRAVDESDLTQHGEEGYRERT